MSTAHCQSLNIKGEPTGSSSDSSVDDAANELRHLIANIAATATEEPTPKSADDDPNRRRSDRKRKPKKFADDMRAESKAQAAAHNAALAATDMNGDNSPNRWNSRCMLCLTDRQDDQTGPILRCERMGCPNVCHQMCARLANVPKSWFCAKHNEKKPRGPAAAAAAAAAAMMGADLPDGMPPAKKMKADGGERTRTYPSSSRDRPEAQLQGVDAFRKALGPYKEHVAEEYSALSWLLRHGDPSRSVVSVPKEYRCPPIPIGPGIEREKKGCGGYAAGFLTIGMWRSVAHLSQGHFHHWYYPRNFDQVGFQTAMEEIEEQTSGVRMSRALKADKSATNGTKPARELKPRFWGSGPRYWAREDMVSVEVQTQDGMAGLEADASPDTAKRALEMLTSSVEMTVDEAQRVLANAEKTYRDEVSLRDRIRDKLANSDNEFAQQEQDLRQQLVQASAAISETEASFNDSVERFKQATTASQDAGVTAARWEEVNDTVGKALAECNTLAAALKASKDRVLDLETKLGNIKHEKDEASRALQNEDRVRTRRSDLAARHVEEMRQCMEGRLSVMSAAQHHGRQLEEALAGLTPIPDCQVESVTIPAPFFSPLLNPMPQPSPMVSGMLPPSTGPIPMPSPGLGPLHPPQSMLPMPGIQHGVSFHSPSLGSMPTQSPLLQSFGGSPALQAMLPPLQPPEHSLF
mmetsp:Transcript_54677/g.119014  ORF Transcript_54677/g.119014 Transcript_54677/m.119014 type:complete len:693 (-) Transcript_54677:85-2163(-)